MFNKTVTKLVTILTNCFFLYLNPASYLKSHCNVDFLVNFLISSSEKALDFY